MAAGAVEAGDKIVEIGPGLGALTEEFLNRGAEVWAMEIDRGICRFLKECLVHQQLHLLCGDALNLDWHDFLPAQNKPYKLIANLPYNITGPLLFKFIDHKNVFTFFLVMVQRELAERLSAEPKTKSYGALTLLVNYHMTIEYLFSVSRRSFFPMPEVDSTVILLKPRPEPPAGPVDEDFLFSVIKTGFGQRRKTLANNLKNLATEPGIIAKAMHLCNLKKECRAEELSLNEFIYLANALQQSREGGNNGSDLLP